jgi:heterodisulfide reductase subunit A2
VVTTGYELIDWATLYGEYGGGRYADVITGLQFERLVNASGPTEGYIQRPSDQTEPKDVVIIKCVGSRDASKGKAYCSRACCMYSAKHAHQILEKIPGSRCYVFYMDVRTAGKAYEEFYERTREDGATYIRGRVAKIYKEGGKLVCKGEDTLIGKPVTVEADMVILETAMVPSLEVEKLAGILGISTDPDKWLQEAHPKLRPVETNTGGIYLAGTCQGPKDIPDTVAQASAAAVKVSALFSNNELETNPMISRVTEDKCSGCGLCVGCCPYSAITFKEIEERVGASRVKRMVASVNSALCQGCGACSAACRPGAIDTQGYSNRQLLEEVDALCL